MSRIVTTEYGRMNLVRDGDERRWLLEIPGCGKWEPLSDAQLAGTLSVNHAAICACGYHETHPYGPTVIAVMQSRILTHGAPCDPELVVS